MYQSQILTIQESWGLLKVTGFNYYLIYEITQNIGLLINLLNCTLIHIFVKICKNLLFIKMVKTYSIVT